MAVQAAGAEISITEHGFVWALCRLFKAFIQFIRYHPAEMNAHIR